MIQDVTPPATEPEFEDRPAPAVEPDEDDNGSS
jgi:hypothetical protein